MRRDDHIAQVRPEQCSSLSGFRFYCLEGSAGTLLCPGDCPSLGMHTTQLVHGPKQLLDSSIDTIA